MFCQLVTVVLASLVSAHQSRSKRIINGETIDSWNTSYTAMRYLASIGTLHRYTYLGLVADGDVHCGGAYITPRVVQTACHCLAVFHGPDGKDLLPASGHHPWENIFYVYIGVDKEFGQGLSMDMTKPLKSKAFLLHQGCARLPKLSLEIYTSDFGWVIIDPDLDQRVVNVNRVSFAPQYTLDEMTKLWEYFQQRRPVCLHLGFGQHKRNVYDSEVLRLGWTNLESYMKCVDITSNGVQSRDLVTWVCTIPFPNHRQSIGYGEVGGPLSCNNFYFGVAAGWEDDYDYEDNEDVLWNHQTINYDNPLVFAVYENALDWRKAFIDFIDQLGKVPLCDIICRMTYGPNQVIDTFCPLRSKSFIALTSDAPCKNFSSLLLISLATAYLSVVCENTLRCF